MEKRRKTANQWQQFIKTRKEDFLRKNLLFSELHSAGRVAEATNSAEKGANERGRREIMKAY